MRAARWRAALAAAAVSLCAGWGPLLAQVPAPPDTSAQRLSLLEALRVAEGRSETVGIARADVARARGERRRARSGYFPQLNGSASYQRTLRSQFSVFRAAEDTATAPAPRECARFTPQPSQSVDERLAALEDAVECASAFDPFASFRDLPFGRENTYRFGLSATQALFTGGRLGGQSQSADAGLRNAELGVTAARAQTLLEVAAAYYDATLGDRLVAIAEATLRQADTTLVQAALAKQVGNQSEFELLRARVTRDNQRPIVIQRRADRDLAYVRLRQLLDLPLDRPLALTTELGDTTLLESPQLADLVTTPGDTVVNRRIVVRQAAEVVTSEQGQLRTARAQRLPQLTLSSDFAELGFPGNGSPFGTDYVSDWTVSLGLALPLFTGGRIKGEVESARAGVEQAELRLKQTRERAQLDTRSAQLQLAAAVAAWQASAGTEEQAARAYQIAELRYREGLSTQTELNDIRIQLAQAQSTRARAARDLQLARARIALLPALPLATGGALPAATADGTGTGSGSGSGTIGSTGPIPVPATTGTGIPGGGTFR
ncbi:MAG TPA: TolC family protein [Gemmatimonadales bacterium]|nr:TolC family protein [Gemmatimonadales bacterium]